MCEGEFLEKLENFYDPILPVSLTALSVHMCEGEFLEKLENFYDPILPVSLTALQRDHLKSTLSYLLLKSYIK